MANKLHILDDNYSTIRLCYKLSDDNFLDENGKKVPFVMGTYGIGVSRLIPAILEQKADDKGCIWTKDTVPFTVDIIISNIKDKEQVKYAEKIYKILQEEKINTILDDRKERFGFKIKDFELIGFSFALIVGKNLKDNIVQIVDRKTLKKIEIDKDKVLEIAKPLSKNSYGEYLKDLVKDD